MGTLSLIGLALGVILLLAGHPAFPPAEAGPRPTTHRSTTLSQTLAGVTSGHARLNSLVALPKTCVTACQGSGDPTAQTDGMRAFATSTTIYLPLISRSFPFPIAFVSNRDGNWEIYAMDPDGGNPRRLTEDPADDLSPSWSPSALLAFTSNRDGDLEIYRVDATGGNLTQLTNNAYNDFGPTWSPDGARIAFVSDRDSTEEIYNEEIYVMNADGTGLIRLTDHPAADRDPAWSPDGQHIAFASNRDGNWEIYVMNADGSNPVNLTNSEGDDSGPAWSPDGAKIAFTSNRDRNSEIYVMDADGRHQTRLTINPAVDARPAWSPDGARIAFMSNRDNNSGTGALPSRHGLATESHALIWRFLVIGEGGPAKSLVRLSEIYVMDAEDGDNLINLTNHPADDIDPAWAP